MVGSLKNGDTDSLFKNQKINGENSDSDSSEDDNIIGPMPPSNQVPPKRKSDSDDEDDDILGSSNIGTIGKVKTAVTLKLKPISISLKTNFDKKKDDNSEGKLDSEKLNPGEKLGSEEKIDSEEKIKSDSMDEKSDTPTPLEGVPEKLPETSKENV